MDNYLNGITYSKSENAVYVAGSFEGGITFGNSITTSTANYNPFVAKLDSAGTALWVAKAASFSFVKGCGVTTDYSGNVFFTGWGNSGTVTFGSSNSSFTAAYTGYIGKITSAGVVQWGKAENNASGAGNSNGFIFPDFGGIDADKYGCVYQSGNYSGTLALDAYNLHCNGEPTGFYDAFLAKLDPNAVTGIEESISANSFEIFPNPSNGIINVAFMNTSSATMINVYNTAGQVVISKKINAAQGLMNEQIDMSCVGKGIYLTQIISNDQVLNKRFVIE